MQVLHFVSTYVPQFGGTTTRLLNLLADPQHEHLLVVRRPPAGSLPADLRDIAPRDRYGHIEVRRVDWDQLGIAGRIPLLNVHAQAAALRAAVPDAPADLVHGHNPTACALAACAEARRRGVPLIYEAHGIMHDYSNLPRPFGPLAPLNRAVHAAMRAVIAQYERHILRCADRIIVQTAASQQHLQQLYGLAGTPFDVVPNGVDPTWFDPARWAAAGRALRDAHGWHDVTVCLYAGYLDRVNGVDLLLDVIPTLDPATRRRLRFVFAGRGPQAEAVRCAAQAPDAIDFLGAVDYQRMPPLLAASDVFLIPRPPVVPAETFRPMKLLEAMAMERVLLVSDVAALAELIRHEDNGLLFRKGNAGALRAALRRIADRPEALASLGPRARQDVLHAHTWDAARRQLAASYAAAVARSAAPTGAAATASRPEAQ